MGTAPFGRYSLSFYYISQKGNAQPGFEDENFFVL